VYVNILFTVTTSMYLLWVLYGHTARLWRRSRPLVKYDEFLMGSADGYMHPNR
jgi:hypothetical protein